MNKLVDSSFPLFSESIFASVVLPLPGSPRIKRIDLFMVGIDYSLNKKISHPDNYQEHKAHKGFVCFVSLWEIKCKFADSFQII